MVRCLGFLAVLILQIPARLAGLSARNARLSGRGAEELIRSYVRRIQANPDVTDAQRAAMGITVPDSTRSTNKANSIGSRPIVTVDTSQRMRHEIAIVDESTPTSKAKPAGVMGCEIWLVVTAVGSCSLRPKPRAQSLFVAEN